MEDVSNLIALSIPEEANLQLPSSDLLNFYENLEERVLWISSEIDEYYLNIIHYIFKWNKEDKLLEPSDRKPIKILIHSCGGDLGIYQAVSDIIKISKTPVIGISVGICYSAAAFIFLNCHKRLMLKSSTILLHKGGIMINGTSDEVRSAMDQYQTEVKRLSNIIKETTNFTEDEIEEKMKGDWYINSDEAFERKVCDKIVTDIEEML